MSGCGGASPGDQCARCTRGQGERDACSERNIAEEGAGRADVAQELASQSRTLRNSIISLAVFFVIVAGLLLGVPGLRAAGELITDADPLRVASAVSLELLSCLGYVVLFGLVFGMLGRPAGLAPVAV